VGTFALNCCIAASSERVVLSNCTITHAYFCLNNCTHHHTTRAEGNARDGVGAAHHTRVPVRRVVTLRCCSLTER
jgi:hypothetical protein